MRAKEVLMQLKDTPSGFKTSLTSQRDSRNSRSGQINDFFTFLSRGDPLVNSATAEGTEDLIEDKYSG